jgi:hypothetical protein
MGLLVACASLAAVVAATVPASARRPTLPEIRMSGPRDVPACVTPGRLMRHLRERTPNLDPRFRDIAHYYKRHGEALGVRWDYAFYQMLLETNYLSYKTGSGRWGDVDPRQNNFAGIGTIGGGVPGDSFPDVSTGVLAQMQHLIAYSGQRVAKPLAPRTREKQEEIIHLSRALRRPVRFDDLTNRWAKDRNYAASIAWVAERYWQANCAADGAPLRPAQDDGEEAAARRPSVAAKPRAACDVLAASYGGTVSLLIRAETAGTVSYTVLQVDEGFEQKQADAFIRTHMPNGRTIERFSSREHAVARAFQLCPAPS